MGVNFSYNSNVDIKNNQTQALTSNEIELIRKSWKLACKEDDSFQKNGANMMIKYKSTNQKHYFIYVFLNFLK